eukprot:10325228-Karenia_brevis.AAC.1
MQKELTLVQNNVKDIHSNVSNLEKGQKDGFGRVEGMLTRLVGLQGARDAPRAAAAADAHVVPPGHVGAGPDGVLPNPLGAT